MNAMSIIKPISIKLQFRYYDIIKAYKEVKDIIMELKALLASDTMLHSLYEQSVMVADELDVVPSVHRTTGRQRHRENPEYSTVEEYYHRSVVIPLLDNLIEQMEERFGNTKVMALKLLCLVPSELSGASTESFEDVASLYSSDLPNPALYSMEVWRWKNKWQACETKPSTLQKTLQECSKDYFPNIHVLLRIACTLPCSYSM